MNYRPKNSFSMSYASRKVIFPGEVYLRARRRYTWEYTLGILGSILRGVLGSILRAYLEYTLKQGGSVQSSTIGSILESILGSILESKLGSVLESEKMYLGVYSEEYLEVS